VDVFVSTVVSLLGNYYRTKIPDGEWYGAPARHEKSYLLQFVICNL